MKQGKIQPRSGGLPWRVIRRDDGLTFIEVIVTFMMVSAAIVATTYSLFFGHRELTVDMHKQQILRIVQQETEYWVGRIYVGTPDDPNVIELAGSARTPYRTVMLDPNSESPIQVRLFYDPIITRAGTINPQEEIAPYYVVTVWAEWTEPDGQDFTRNRGNHVSLTTYVRHRVG